MSKPALRTVFLEDSAWFLKEMETALNRLKRDRENVRAMHDLTVLASHVSLYSWFVGLEQIASLAQLIEDLLTRLRSEGLPATDPMLEPLTRCIEHLRGRLHDLNGEVVNG